MGRYTLLDLGRPARAAALMRVPDPPASTTAATRGSLRAPRWSMGAPYLPHGARDMRVQPSSDPDIVILLGEDAPGALSPDTAESLVARLQAAPDLDAVGPLVPVVDAHKRIDADGRVVEALDRSRLAHLGRPAAVRRVALEAGRIDRIGLW